MDLFRLFILLVTFVVASWGQQQQPRGEEVPLDELLSKGTNSLDSLAFSLLMGHLKRPKDSNKNNHVTGYYVMDRHMVNNNKPLPPAAVVAATATPLTTGEVTMTSTMSSYLLPLLDVSTSGVEMEPPSIHAISHYGGEQNSAASSSSGVFVMSPPEVSAKAHYGVTHGDRSASASSTATESPTTTTTTTFRPTSTSTQQESRFPVTFSLSTLRTIRPSTVSTTRQPTSIPTLRNPSPVIVTSPPQIAPVKSLEEIIQGLSLQQPQQRRPAFVPATPVPFQSPLMDMVPALQYTPGVTRPSPIPLQQQKRPNYNTPLQFGTVNVPQKKQQKPKIVQEVKVENIDDMYPPGWKAALAALSGNSIRYAVANKQQQSSYRPQPPPVVSKATYSTIKFEKASSSSSALKRPLPTHPQVIFMQNTRRPQPPPPASTGTVVRNSLLLTNEKKSSPSPQYTLLI